MPNRPCCFILLIHVPFCTPLKKAHVIFSDFKRAFAIAIAIPVGFVFAQDAPAEKLDLDKFPGEIVEKVVVPVPAEVFAVLDKLGAPNWNGQIFVREENAGGKIDRVSVALEFGALVAEGFIAVQAENVPEVKRVGEQALKLGNSLGLGDAVQPHSQSIVEAAEVGEWQKVRSELDKTQATVRSTMEQLRDEDLGNLVSLGGWIRGTNALTALISENFSQDKAELLNQPVLIDHFIKTVDAMSGPVKNHKKVAKVAEGLALLKQLLGAEEEAISADVVSEMGEVCSGLLELYYFPSKEAGNENEGADE